MDLNIYICKERKKDEPNNKIMIAKFGSLKTHTHTPKLVQCLYLTNKAIEMNGKLKVT